MPNRLLDRQVSLLEYLTSGEAIFGARSSTPTEPGLGGIDRHLLDLEARFSHEKRMQKIREVFPRTFRLLGNEEPSVVEAFARACPPIDISRLVNARQFADFLTTGRPSARAWLCDVAACELAIAQVRSESGDAEAAKFGMRANGRARIRRRPGIVLLHCAHDIRPLFERDGSDFPVTARDTRLVVAVPPGCNEPHVFELPPLIFDLLARLDGWISLDELGATIELGEVVNELTEHGLIEVSA